MAKALTRKRIVAVGAALVVPQSFFVLDFDPELLVFRHRHSLNVRLSIRNSGELTRLKRSAWIPRAQLAPGFCVHESRSVTARLNTMAPGTESCMSATK